ncbi:MAG: hypothetical protein ACKOPO_10120 [Novosphingobium sp.]
MNATARPWIGLFFKCLSVLALIFVFIFFMKMQEDRSANDKLRNHGVVSRAVVVEKKQDELTRTQSSGARARSTSTTTTDLWVVNVRHVPKSAVPYGDYPSRVKDADLPVAPPLAADDKPENNLTGIMWVSKEVYDQTRVGDSFAVVNTPWDADSPVRVTEVEAFDPSPAYPRMAIAFVLALLFWFIDRRISKASMLRGIVEVSKIPGAMR